MEDSHSYRTGIIENSAGNLVFFTKDFSFHFMLPDYIPFSHSNSRILKSDDSGFIFGTTHDNYSIAIATGNQDITVNGEQTFKTDMYLVTSGNTMPYPRDTAILYDGIMFSGKTLNRVFYPDALDIVPSDEGTLVKYKDDSKTYSFEADGIQYTVKVNSVANQGSRHFGQYVVNQNICLQLTFSKQQTAKDIAKHYNNICTLLSFMTFRSIVDFDRVSLLKQDSQYPGGYCTTWNLYIKTQPEQCQKNQITCITFDDLDGSVGNLLKIIYDSKDRMPSLSLDFIPETDKKVLYVDGDSIKSICSGLECELAFLDIQQSEEAQNIQTLALEVESLIKKHRLGPSPLSKKSYDKIFGDIKHWGMATADSIIELYHKHQIAMSIICRHIGADITDDDIEKFIKYRNDIIMTAMAEVLYNDLRKE